MVIFICTFLHINAHQQITTVSVPRIDGCPKLHEFSANILAWLFVFSMTVFLLGVYYISF